MCFIFPGWYLFWGAVTIRLDALLIIKKDICKCSTKSVKLFWEITGDLRPQNTQKPYIHENLTSYFFFNLILSTRSKKFFKKKRTELNKLLRLTIKPLIFLPSLFLSRDIYFEIKVYINRNKWYCLNVHALTEIVWNNLRLLFLHNIKITD